VRDESEQLLVWNGVVARVPALVIRPNSVQDVAAALELARDHGLHLRVGTAGGERAVTLDLRRQREP
jgi:FAD/FMN-containing dehydrogenase